MDGKSPADYMNEKVRTKVRATASRLLLDPPPSIADFIEDWRLTFFP
jgi:hypothetical protein